jgi:hypothetical protein
MAVAEPIYNNIYSTPYTDCSKRDCRQAEVIIVGQEGKQIQIDQLSLSLCVAASKVTATAWINITVDGIEKQLASWTETKTAYQSKSENPAYLAPAGVSVMLSWRLKTTNSATRAKMRYLKYGYSYVDVPAEEPEPEETDVLASVQVSCPSVEDAEALKKEIAPYVGEREITIWKQS